VHPKVARTPVLLPDPGNGPGTPFWSSADQWFNTFGFASIPSYYDEGAAEVSYYSRPEVSYHIIIPTILCGAIT